MSQLISVSNIESSSDDQGPTDYDSGFPTKYDPDFSHMSRKELREYILVRNYSTASITNQRFNWISHLVTGLVVLIGTLYLCVKSDSMVKLVAFIFYLSGNAAMLFGSFLHHFVGLSGRSISMYRALRMVDHCGIFIVIAETFGPFALVFAGQLGFAVFFYLQFVMVCSLALKLITRHTLNQNVFNFIYLAMGWSALIVLYSIVQCVGWTCVMIVFLGGVSYSVGIIFFQR